MEKHAPLRKKFFKGNHAAFMNKGLKKQSIQDLDYVISFASPSKENEALFKKQRNKCVSLRRKSIKKYFNDFTKYGIATSKSL